MVTLVAWLALASVLPETAFNTTVSSLSLACNNILEKGPSETFRCRIYEVRRSKVLKLVGRSLTHMGLFTGARLSSPANAGPSYHNDSIFVVPQYIFFISSFVIRSHIVKYIQNMLFK